MKIFDDPQGSPEWFEHRRGKPTASCFDRILTPAKGELSSGIDSYICELIAERYYLGEIDRLDDKATAAMRNGTDTEPEARRLYEFDRDVDVHTVGFVLSDCERWGCSPDGLIWTQRRGLEIKCPLPSTHIRWMLDGVLPRDHKCQVHGGMAVTGYEQWDFISYVPGLPTFIVEVKRDDFTKRLLEALESFDARYHEILNTLDLPPATPLRHEEIELPAALAV